MDATQTGILIAAVSSGITAVVAVMATKGIDGWIKLRADKRIDETREEKSANEVLMFTITRQDARIAKLEDELRAVYIAHNECERKYAALSTRLDRIDAAAASMQSSVSTMQDTQNAATAAAKHPQPVEIVNTDPVPVAVIQK